MKAIKLTLAVVFTALVLFSWRFPVADRLYWTYRCSRQAISILSCYGRRREFDFSADLFGLYYEGNTGNYIDKQIFDYGAYEKPVLFLLRDLMTNGYSTKGVFL